MTVDETGYYKISWKCEHINKAFESDIFGNIKEANMNRVALTVGCEVDPCEVCGAEPVLEKL